MRGWIFLGIVISATLIGVAVGCGDKGSRVKVSELREPVNLPGRLCPNGHAAVREVPILYGHLKKTADLETAFKSGDAIYGGEHLGMYGKTALSCSRCRFFYYNITEHWHDTRGKVVPNGLAR